MGERYVNGPIELRLGRYQDVLADVSKCDAVITDPPYGLQTHEGARTGDEIRKSKIGYDPITRADARACVRAWWPRVSGWALVFGDHRTCGWWRCSLAREGAYVFQPIVWAKPDSAPRFSGDGPASAVEWIAAARTRGAPKPGSLPGYYVCPTASTRGFAEGLNGAKPIALMRALVRDYSRPGDLIVDPFAGSCTTGLACAIEGRKFIGSECDPKTYELAVRRLSAGWTPGLPGVGP